MIVADIQATLSTNNNVQRISGPLLFLKRVVAAGLGDAVEVTGDDGQTRPGRIAAIDSERMIIEMLATTHNLSLAGTSVRFFERQLHFGVGPGLLGRVFNGVGEIIDGGPQVPIVAERPVAGLPLNPVARALPRDFIETGISSIDLMNSLVRGQKLPIFSGSGLPHDKLAWQITSQSHLLNEAESDFAIVFAGIGIAHDVAARFQRVMEESGAVSRTVMFINLASEASIQRLLVPRYALTAAEYLAFEEGRHVLVVLTDLTNYCEALREVSASHGEIPGRKSYPGHMYSDLASIYERAGRLRDSKGSLTQLPILTMPGDDISHPIPDLTGYITEGQIVLGRTLDRQGIFPPVAVLPSLSRLMDEGTGEGYTHADHPALASQLYAAYARAQQVRMLASVVGDEGLPESDRLYLRFGTLFEHKLVHQETRRSLAESMEIGWNLLQYLPRDELTRLSDAQIARNLDSAVTKEGMFDGA